MNELPHGLVAADWGTTNLRAFRLAADGRVVEGRDAPAGILNVAGGRFEAAFDRALGDWLAASPEAPGPLSGRIGSRQGRLETAYVDALPTQP